MKLSSNPQVWKWLGLIFLSLSLVFIILFYFQSIFFILLVGIIMIVFTDKLSHYFYMKERKYKLGKYSAKIFTWSINISLLLIFYFLMSHSFTQINSTFATLDRGDQSITSVYVEKLRPFFTEDIGDALLSESNILYVENLVFDYITIFISSVPSLLLNAILIIPLMFHFHFRKQKAFFKKVFSIIPEKFHTEVVHSVKKINKLLSDFLFAKIVESVVIAIIASIGFFLIGLKGWLFLGLFAGFLNIIPFIGPLVGAIPAVLVALLQDQMIAVYVIGIILFAQAVDNFYLIPFFISNRVRMDPLINVLLILVGAQLMGAIGMVLSIPLYLIYKIVLLESYKVLVGIYGEQ